MALANYFAVFGRQSESMGTPNAETKFKKGKLLPQNERALIDIARTVKLEAESVAEAQEIVKEAFPGQNTGTAVVVTEAAWKES